MDVRPSTIRVMGLRTRVLTAGDPASSGTPVLLIHGVGGWAENFREVMEPIAASGRRAIAVDLPGFGETEAPGRVAHFGPNNAYYPQFVLSLMDGLGVDKAHLVGSSMGGAVAYMAAVSAPERASSLTLVASGGLGTDIAMFLRVATLPGMITLAKVFGKPRQGREVLRSCFFDASRIPETLYAESERYGFDSYPEFVRALRSGVTIRGVRANVRDHWVKMAAGYRGPVLAIWGREDAVLPIHHLAGAKEVFPQAEVRIIERCGHLPMIERTQEFLVAALPFLDRAEQTTVSPAASGVAPLTANA
jgi:pimeloyl-ACP methyl ester carboxylesterase